MWGLNTAKLIKNIRDHKPNGPEETISRSKPNINIIQIDVLFYLYAAMCKSLSKVNK